MISQADGARLMAAAQNWITASIAGGNTASGSALNRRYAAIAKRTEQEFTDLVATLIDENDR